MKLRNLILISTILSLILMYSSCRKFSLVDGNQHLITETRRLVPFTKVINESDINVFIIEDSISEAVVECESNLIPYIRTIVNGNTLVIDTRENLNPNLPINIYVRTPEVNSIKLSGSGRIEVDTLTGTNVEVIISGSGSISGNLIANIADLYISGSGNMWMGLQSQITYAKISGSGDLNLSGISDQGNFDINGSGRIYSYDLLQNRLETTISGSGDMYVNVYEYLKVKISGSGSVYYHGNPSLDISITGSGSVINQ